ncbi:hypothetical protein LTR10_009450 [Elasticomyces elasticus]|nr:hypothetical protein LTR10_009450 [Elasticomyces elasticus]KAK4971451.1 hypothetical protein LTR42_007179 [Elasticomyces elasticus]
MAASTIANSAMGSVNYGPSDPLRNEARPGGYHIFSPGQTWLCDSRNNPACWSGVCGHGNGTPMNCPTQPDFDSSTQNQNAQLQQQAYTPIDQNNYASRSFVTPTSASGSRGSTSIDSAAWLPDVTDAKEADTAVTPPSASSASASQRSTKRAAGGEIVRPKGRRLPHNLIERRYRDNLNHQIEVLRDELPTFKSIVACTADIEDPSSLGGKWPSKAVVIAAAVQYIALLEQERGQANARNTLLCEQVEGLQKLVRCDDCSIVKYLEGMQPRLVPGQ